MSFGWRGRCIRAQCESKARRRSMAKQSSSQASRTAARPSSRPRGYTSNSLPNNSNDSSRNSKQTTFYIQPYSSHTTAIMSGLEKALFNLKVRPYRLAGSSSPLIPRIAPEHLRDCRLTLACSSQQSNSTDKPPKPAKTRRPRRTSLRRCVSLFSPPTFQRAKY